MNRLLLVLLLAPSTMAAQSTLNDLDGDGCVGATDILVILGQYGECQDTTTAFVCGDSVLFDNYWYETVMIGDQCWFAENLRTTTYADGTAIPEVMDNSTWTGLSSGARCDYGNDSSKCVDLWSPVQLVCYYGFSRLMSSKLACTHRYRMEFFGNRTRYGRRCVVERMARHR